MTHETWAVLAVFLPRHTSCLERLNAEIEMHRQQSGEIQPSQRPDEEKPPVG